MRLRLILQVLSLLAFLLAVIGGSLYYTSIKEAALKEADRQAKTRLALIARTISASLTENIKVVKALAQMEPLLEILVRPGKQAQDRANAILDLYKESLQADVCYLMNYQGNTIASSNRNAPDSFVGKNFAFRPYFQEAFHKAPATYLALGTTSLKRGVYFSYPIFEKGEDLPIGLVVIKGSIEKIERELKLPPEEIVLVTDPNGVVFISNIKEWLFGVIWQISAQDRQVLAESRQFGRGPWEWIGLRQLSDHMAVSRDGTTYQMHRTAIDPEHYPGWQAIYLRSQHTLMQRIGSPLFKTTGPMVALLCVLVGIVVFSLYRFASKEISQRRAVEKALRQSEMRYRSLYHNTPAMLHSIDPAGHLLSVSDYWCEALGYARQEVIGRQLTGFLTPESKRFAEHTVFPAFFKSGFCKDIPYRFVCKNGQTIDVLLSAIADRNSDGRIVRTLAVSMDVTERKRAEEALQQATEKLSRYSKDLERQVQLRTKEISSILKYTPAVVYMKDLEGRYQLVNSRYEELFGQKNENIRGKTDFQVLPREVAQQFRNHDVEVLLKRQPLQVEERIVQNGMVHTYLSVKFPIYDESGKAHGVCGIATDITAVKKAQDQLRRLSASIMANQEKERSALARELHDELGQVLTALRMDAVWIHHRYKEADEGTAERALTMCRLIDKTIDDVRGLAFRLRPGMLDDLGLVDALELFTTDFERRTGITCVFEHRAVPETEDAVATAAYRITQEALTNVARHAEAVHVHVKLAVENGYLTLSVEDDGCGFNTETLGESEGLGLAGMRERAALAGGILDIDSQPQNGTAVHFRVSTHQLNPTA